MLFVNLLLVKTSLTVTWAKPAESHRRKIVQLAVRPHVAAAPSSSTEWRELDLVEGDVVRIVGRPEQTGPRKGWLYGEKDVAPDEKSGAPHRVVRGHFPDNCVVQRPEAPKFALAAHRSDLSRQSSWLQGQQQIRRLVMNVLRNNADSVRVTAMLARHCGCNDVPKIWRGGVGLACRSSLEVMPTDCVTDQGHSCTVTEKGTGKRLHWVILFCPPGFVQTCLRGCVLDGDDYDLDVRMVGALASGAVNGLSESALHSSVLHVISRFGGAVWGDFAVDDGRRRSSKSGGGSSGSSAAEEESAERANNRISLGEVESRGRGGGGGLLSTDAGQRTQVWRDIVFTGKSGGGAPRIKCSVSSSLAAAVRAQLCGVALARENAAEAEVEARQSRDLTRIAGRDEAIPSSMLAGASGRLGENETSACSIDVPLPACPKNWTIGCPSDRNLGGWGEWGCRLPQFATRAEKRAAIVAALKDVARATSSSPYDAAEAKNIGMAEKLPTRRRARTRRLRNGTTCSYNARLNVVQRQTLPSGLLPAIRSLLAEVGKPALEGDYVKLYVSGDRLPYTSKLGQSPRFAHNSSQNVHTLMLLQAELRVGIQRAMARVRGNRGNESDAIVTGEWAIAEITAWNQHAARHWKGKGTDGGLRRTHWRTEQVDACAVSFAERMHTSSSLNARGAATAAAAYAPHPTLSQIVLVSSRRHRRLSFRRNLHSDSKDRFKVSLNAGDSAIFSSGAENAYKIAPDPTRSHWLLFVRWKRPGLRSEESQKLYEASRDYQPHIPDDEFTTRAATPDEASGRAAATPLAS